MASPSFLPPQERTFELRNGIILAAKHWRSHESARSRHCRRFLALHGYLDNACSFDPLAPLMLHMLGPEPVEIVALDHAGHGLSSHRQTEDYGIWRYCEDADQIVEQLGWQKHAVIGHSMGGAVASTYSGLFPSRVLMCVMLDSFGAWTRDIDDQPQHLLEHIAEKKVLAIKRRPLHRTIESACIARSKGAYPMQLEYARILVPRGLVPIERTDEDGKTIQGWTWSSDPLLTIRSAQSLSDEYVHAFLRRIECPVLAVLASNGLFNMKEFIERRTAWFEKSKPTIKRAKGNHSVHMEDARTIAEIVCDWILSQDIRNVSRL